MGDPRDEKTLLSKPSAPSNEFPRPTVPEDRLAEWQTAVDSMAERLGVPVGLIKKAEFQRTIVLVANKDGDHSFKRGDAARLDSGLYCETVMGRRRELLVRNALEDPEWAGGRAVKLGFVSYLGYPLLWPDGEIFGTLCVLDREEHSFSPEAQELMVGIKETIERDLAGL
jgi:GAF domain-containing protein